MVVVVAAAAAAAGVEKTSSRVAVECSVDGEIVEVVVGPPLLCLALIALTPSAAVAAAVPRLEE